ncbi:MAG: OsmC family protein [Gemmatimonadaceae bacterium]
MRIRLIGNRAIRFHGGDSRVSIEEPSPDDRCNSFHLLAAGLASCTHSVLQSWADAASISTGDLAIDVRWTFAREPRRIGVIDVDIIWPGLPEDRRVEVRRTALLCTVHSTLSHPPEISIDVSG